MSETTSGRDEAQGHYLLIDKSHLLVFSKERNSCNSEISSNQGFK